MLWLPFLPLPHSFDTNLICSKNTKKKGKKIGKRKNACEKMLADCSGGMKWGVVWMGLGIYRLWCWLGDFKPQVEAKQLMKFSLKEAAEKKN